VSRDELNAQQLAELAALDRILAREPVGEEHLELAALVDSVRAGAPQMDRDFAARLDATIAQRVAARALAACGLPRPGLRRLAVRGRRPSGRRGGADDRDLGWTAEPAEASAPNTARRVRSARSAPPWRRPTGSPGPSGPTARSARTATPGSAGAQTAR